MSESSYSRWLRDTVLALACVIAFLPLAACGLKSSENADESGSHSATTVATTNSTSKTDKHGKTISTPVGKLVCPSAWGDDVRIEDNTSNGVGSIEFVATTGGSKTKLFSLEFGDTNMGYELGTVPDASGTPVKVGVDIQEIGKTGELSDDDVSTLSGLQDGVNELLDQIYKADGFQAVNN